MGQLMRCESALLISGIIKAISKKSNQNVLRHSEQFVKTFKWHNEDLIVSRTDATSPNPKAYLGFCS